MQGRVAALLPDEMSAALNSYYSPLQTLLTLRSFGESAKRRFIRDLKRKYTKQTGEEVPASRNPWKEYQDETLDAQERARERILAYLSLPWDDRLILRLRLWVNKRWQRSSREES